MPTKGAQGQVTPAPEERPIELGMSDGINTEVVGGLQVGDRVLEKKAKEIR